MSTKTKHELHVAAEIETFKALDKRFPGLGQQVEESMAVAIDGVLFQDSLIDPIGPDSEVHLIPKIAGG